MAESKRSPVRSEEVLAAVAAASTATIDAKVRANARERLGPAASGKSLSHLDANTRDAFMRGTERLDIPERVGLTKYTDYDNKAINRYLRTGEVRALTPDGKLAKVAEPAKAAHTQSILNSRVDQIDAAVRSQRIPSGTHLYRGTGTSHLGGVDKIKPGTVITDRGYLSTTVDRKVTEQFTTDAKQRGSKPVTMVINAGGARGIAVENISRFKAEREVVLPRDTKLTVDRVERGVRTNGIFGGRRSAVATVRARCRCDVCRSQQDRAARRACRRKSEHRTGRARHASGHPEA